MRHILGVDIGGTNLVVGCVARDGSALRGLRSEPTRAAEGPEAIVERIGVMAEQAIGEMVGEVPDATIDGAGVGCPGPLDPVTGIVFLTPNLGWRNFPLRDHIQQRLELPAAIDNDANCAILGEWWQGAAIGTRHTIGITIGTGIGGGIILNGSLYRGYSNMAGELGHTTIDADGRLCKCGNYGCLEAYASGTAIARRALEALGAGAESDLAEYVDGDLKKLTAQTVYQAAEQGDDLALEVVRDTSRLLGAGVANLVNIFNPELVVVCGGVTRAGADLLDPLRREVRRRAFRPAAEACRIAPGALSGTAGVYGAARVFLDYEADGIVEGLGMARLGIIGSLVWDVIHGRDPAAPPVEEWGGIAYALGGLDAALPEEWEIVPLIKVGMDMSRSAQQFFGSLDRLAPSARAIEVPVPNNRVVLHYQSAERRCERMEGGVPAWTWAELGPMVRDLDAIYLNFISGFEMTLGTAQALRQGFQGPIYADLHSLFLGMQHDGIRRIQPLAEAPAWFACFDVVQLNEEEMHQLAGDPLAVAAVALGAGVSLLVVTLGPRGAVYVAAPGLTRLGDRAHARTLGDTVRTALLESPRVEALDPTGCGDVFGGTLCAELLGNRDIEGAIGRANAMAGRNARHRGATDLAPVLRGELVIEQRQRTP